MVGIRVYSCSAEETMRSPWQFELRVRASRHLEGLHPHLAVLAGLGGIAEGRQWGGRQRSTWNGCHFDRRVEGVVVRRATGCGRWARSFAHFFISLQDVLGERLGELDRSAPSRSCRSRIRLRDGPPDLAVDGEPAIRQVRRRHQARHRSVRLVEHVELGMECRHRHERSAIQGRGAGNAHVRLHLLPHPQCGRFRHAEVQRRNNGLVDAPQVAIRCIACNGIEQHSAAHARQVGAAYAHPRQTISHQVVERVLDRRRSALALHYEHLCA